MFHGCQPRFIDYQEHTDLTEHEVSHEQASHHTSTQDHHYPLTQVGPSRRVRSELGPAPVEAIDWEPRRTTGWVRGYPARFTRRREATWWATPTSSTPTGDTILLFHLPVSQGYPIHPG